ncbi:MAG: acyl-CoA thioesterase [Bacteroidia bacterium]|nr:acyl-CoA thioesterase [Bacteroidia bacterium]
MRDYKHFTPIQIRFKDIDALGHVNNANHITYLELARISYFEEVVGSNINWNEKGIILANSSIDYLSPVYLKEALKVGTRCSGLGTKSFTLEYSMQVERGGKTVEVAKARTVLVCYNYRKSQPMNMPPVWRKKLVAFDQPKQK